MSRTERLSVVIRGGSSSPSGRCSSSFFSKNPKNPAKVAAKKTEDEDEDLLDGLASSLLESCW